MRNITLEHEILIVLYLLSYLGAMFIQIRDPKMRVTWHDWFLALLTSSVGGTITYLMVMGWANMGFRVGVTILSTLLSYRTFKFILSNESQEAFAKGLTTGLLNMLNKVFKNDKDDNSINN